MAHVAHPHRTGSDFLDAVAVALDVLDGTGTDGGTHAPMPDVLAFYEAQVSDGQLSWTIRDEPYPTQVAADIARNSIEGEDAFDRVKRKLAGRRPPNDDDAFKRFARKHPRRQQARDNDFLAGAYEAAQIIDGEIIAHNVNKGTEAPPVADAEIAPPPRKEPSVGEVDENGLTYLGSSSLEFRENPFL